MWIIYVHCIPLQKETAVYIRNARREQFITPEPYGRKGKSIMLSLVVFDTIFVVLKLKT